MKIDESAHENGGVCQYVWCFTVTPVIAHPRHPCPVEPDGKLLCGPCLGPPLRRGCRERPTSRGLVCVFARGCVCVCVRMCVCVGWVVVVGGVDGSVDRVAMPTE